MQTEKANLELTKDLYRSMDAVDVERIGKLVSRDVKTFISGKVLDFDSWLGMGRMFMTAFPDGKHVFEMAEATGDYVLLNGYFTGTHKQEFHGIPATGRVVKCSLTIIDKVVDGKLVEHRGDFDTATLMQQLTQ